MEFYRRLFVLRGKPPRSIHSTETSFSFTPGTTVRFYVGIGSPLSPAPDPGSTRSWPGAAPAAAASNSISLMESPPAPGFSLIFRKQAVLFPPCQRGGPSLPASSQIAEQVTRSIAPPECPLHWANKRTRAHTHTHSHSPITPYKKGAMSMEEVSLSGKDPIHSPQPRHLCRLWVGKVHDRNGDMMKNRPKAGLA